MISPISLRNLSSSQITVAAESFAVAQFALAGFDVLEHGGPSRSRFDLAVARSGGMMTVSIHASLNGFWDIVDRYLEPSSEKSATAAEYHCAVNLWLEHQSSRATCCLVQFEPADLTGMPRLYLASAGEVAARFHMIIEQITSDKFEPRGMDVVHHLDGMPRAWRFSPARIAELMDLPLEETAFAAAFSTAISCKDCAASKPAACANCLPMMN